MFIFLPQYVKPKTYMQPNEKHHSIKPFIVLKAMRKNVIGKSF